MKIKYYFFSLIPICILAFVLRIAELVTAVEPETGFYVLNNNFPLIFNLYCILASAFLITPFFLVKKEDKPIYKKYYTLHKREKWSLLVASVFLLAAAGETYIISIVQQTAQPFGFELPILIAAVLTVLFSVLYATSSKSVIKSSAASGFSIVFTMYYILRLFSVFLNPTTILAKAYTTFSVLFLSAAALFFLNFSKMLAGTAAKRLLYTFGFCTILFGSIRFADLIVKLFPGNPYRIDDNILTYVADLAILFVVLFTLLHLAHNNPKPETTDAQLR